MSDKTVNTVFTAQDKMSATVKKVRGELGGFQKSVGGVKGAIPIFDKLSAATGGLVNPTTLAIGAVVGFGGVLIESAKKAAAEEVNVAKLGASLRANVPLASMFGYATTLRSRTQGRGGFVMEFDHYAPIALETVEEREKAR